MIQFENTEEALRYWQNKVSKITRSVLEGPITADLIDLFSCNVLVTRSDSHCEDIRISDMFRARVLELCPEIEQLADALRTSYVNNGIQGAQCALIEQFKSLPPMMRIQCWNSLMKFDQMNYEFIKSMHFHFSDSVLRIFLDFQRNN